jgi:hypothetical protein
MPYEIFERKTPRIGVPTVSFTKIGQIAFNQAAARILQKESIETILLMWDAAAKKIAMKVTSNKKDQRAYTIRYNNKGNGASFSAKTFLDHIGVDLTGRRAIPITINLNSELFVEVEVPETFFKMGGIQRVQLRQTAS